MPDEIRFIRHSATTTIITSSQAYFSHLNKKVSKFLLISVLGSFSGKVGTVIGASWKGINYMRSIPQHVKEPCIEGQVGQRSKFALTLNFLKPITGFLRTGWKLYAHRQPPFNAAMFYTLANVITGTYPDYDIDLSKVLVSRGGLAPTANASAMPEGSGIVNPIKIIFQPIFIKLFVPYLRHNIYAVFM
jgi:hypothetical protein